jgi:D-isomer specific 2-hydroxyacid dehydrogenase, NAD binding domain
LPASSEGEGPSNESCDPDDYQHVALGLADWSAVRRHAEITVFNDHVADPSGVVERLRPFDAIAGAAVDVFEEEPLGLDHPFRKLENVLATPHIGYVTEDLYRTFYGDAAANIARWLEVNATAA